MSHQYYDRLLIDTWYTGSDQLRIDAYNQAHAWYSKNPVPKQDVERIYKNIEFYPKPSYNKTIAIYCVQGFQWDTGTAGLNGSEEAVVYLSRELALLGYKIFVFSNPPQDSSDRIQFSNPQFMYVSEFPKDNVNFDILIIWRQYDKNELAKCANKTYIWPHDMLTPNNLHKDNLKNIDGILWLSHFQHFDALINCPDIIKFELEKGFSIYGNGIVTQQFTERPKKSKSCIYASNYVRGLEMLLMVWPDIKKEVPEATLNIYYGWVTWSSHPDITRAITHIKQMLIELKDQGVSEHGSVDHLTLANAFAESEYWLYPCTYPESYCITAIKAQQAKCIPVYFNYGALKETVKTGYACNNLFDLKEYTTLAINAIKGDYNEQNEKFKVIREMFLKEHTWSKVAERWNNTFTGSQ